MIPSAAEEPFRKCPRDESLDKDGSALSAKGGAFEDQLGKRCCVAGEGRGNAHGFLHLLESVLRLLKKAPYDAFGEVVFAAAALPVLLVVLVVIHVPDLGEDLHVDDAFRVDRHLGRCGRCR